ncbi:MAG: sporulation transcriptional regulator SpoIIID [Oscillospiraceae bacterium]|nr:sporulation transcriptional regulator SpoIIID [Oscillospiraceae bacterium]
MRKHNRTGHCSGCCAAQARAQALDDRAVALGTYIAEHGATVRSTAKAFGISKSTVHKDISVRLPVLHAGLYERVREITEKNKQERHIRGGLATKRKYERQRISAAGRDRPSAPPRPQSVLCKTDQISGRFLCKWAYPKKTGLSPLDKF